MPIDARGREPRDCGEGKKSTNDTDESLTLFERAANALAGAADQIGDIGGAFTEKVADLASSGAAFVTDTASAAVEVSTDAYAGSRLEAAVNYVGDGLEERGVFSAIAAATEAVGDKVGQVTGKRLVEMLEEKLRLQDQYNDLLATRLAEALERITKLEERLNHVDR